MTRNALVTARPRRRKLRRQSLLRVRAETNKPTDQTPRRYASRRELLGSEASAATPEQFRWTSAPFRVGSIATFFLLYPVAWAATERLPPPNAFEGGLGPRV